MYSRRRCLSRDNSYTSKDGRGLVSKVSLNSCQRGCRHRFPVDKAASARCGCSNDHLIRERKNERENKRVSRLGSMLRKKKKKRGGDRKKKKRSIFIHPTYPTHSSLDPLLSSTRNKEKISWIRSTTDYLTDERSPIKHSEILNGVVMSVLARWRCP